MLSVYANKDAAKKDTDVRSFQEWVALMYGFATAHIVSYTWFCYSSSPRDTFHKQWKLPNDMQALYPKTVLFLT